ncbi:MAG: DUF6517 family protein [Halorubrum sp.]
MHRRRFIGSAVGVGALTAAGCLASASSRPPNVPESALDDGGWALDESIQEEAFSETVAGQEFTATATTEIYENVPLREELEAKTLGQIASAPVVFFASRVTFDPDLTNLPGGVGRGQIVSEVEANARATLEDQMTADGVENVEVVSEGELAIDTGETARRTDVTGALPFAPVSVPVTDDRRIELETDEVPVAGRLAVWHAEESVLVGGGAFPAENVAETMDEELSAAISVSVEVDLGLTPEEYEAELLDLVRALE